MQRVHVRPCTSGAYSVRTRVYVSQVQSAYASLSRVQNGGGAKAKTVFSGAVSARASLFLRKTSSRSVSDVPCKTNSIEMTRNDIVKHSDTLSMGIFTLVLNPPRRVSLTACPRPDPASTPATRRWRWPSWRRRSGRCIWRYRSAHRCSGWFRASGRTSRNTSHARSALCETKGGTGTSGVPIVRGRFRNGGWGDSRFAQSRSRVARTYREEFLRVRIRQLRLDLVHHRLILLVAHLTERGRRVTRRAMTEARLRE